MLTEKSFETLRFGFEFSSPNGEHRRGHRGHRGRCPKHWALRPPRRCDTAEVDFPVPVAPARASSDVDFWGRFLGRIFGSNFVP